MKTLYKFGLIFAFVGTAHAATVVPKITKISVTPTSSTAGTMFKFTAELNNALPNNYKLKIDTLGKKAYSTMTGTNTSYSLSRTLYTAGTFNYKVVIVNAKNVTQGVAKVGSYSVTSVAPLNHAPMLSLVKAETSAITNNVYTVTLNAKDVDANLNSITMNWGDNSEPETLTATDSNDLVFKHTYTTADSFGWNAFASDKGTPILNSKSISKIVTVSNPAPVEVITPPAKTTGYTKIANDGSELPDSAILGTNPKDWACTKDNKTGLIWEVKTNDGGLRDQYNRYSWYEPDFIKSDGFQGYKNGNGHSEWCDSSDCDTDSFIRAVNRETLCGKTDWRIPTKEELGSIVFCSNGKSKTTCNFPYPSPTITTEYFPDIKDSFIFWKDNYVYWTSSSYTFGSVGAWLVDFYSGGNDSDYKVNGNYVRLVRNEQ